ncbi:unnamed protein product [Dracunculus medinensis]|uniref:Uncharacterized protein n=1 Tax=Dracunculus medinensis TaxID=318479 RepID=A0A0N4UH29_DRAME|nr:unnamed protein product [Dracunculus medinensis]
MPSNSPSLALSILQLPSIRLIVLWKMMECPREDHSVHEGTLSAHSGTRNILSWVDDSEPRLIIEHVNAPLAVIEELLDANTND